VADAGYWILDTGFSASKLNAKTNDELHIAPTDMSYRDLEVWQLARQSSVEIHEMNLRCLPKFELYEEGSQIRRSSKSVRSNIVEGYGRRGYKQEFIRFLTFALASCDETTDHLETLQETGSLQDAEVYARLHDSLQVLGKKLNNFIQSVTDQHQSLK
jgi:four helix bundle protein